MVNTVTAPLLKANGQKIQMKAQLRLKMLDACGTDDVILPHSV